MGLPIDEDWLLKNGISRETLDRAKGLSIDAERSRSIQEDLHDPGPWEVPVEDWMPTPLNKLLGVHWGTRSSRKKRDREAVCYAASQVRVPPPACKRRVSLRVTLPKRKRRTDVDSLQKTTLDACVHAKLIKDDTEDWAEWGNVAWERGEVLRTIIVVEDC